MKHIRNDLPIFATPFKDEQIGTVKGETRVSERCFDATDHDGLRAIVGDDQSIDRVVQRAVMLGQHGENLARVYGQRH